MAQRGRKPETTRDLDRVICLFAEQKLSAKKILDILRTNDFYGGLPISVRTVGNRIAACRNLDDTTPWSPFELDDENTLDDVRRVLPVLGWLAGESWGQSWMSRATAWWVSRICAIADPPSDWAWAFAKAYQWAKGRMDKDTRCLDLALMSRVWDMTGVSGSKDLNDAEENLRAMEGNAIRQQALESSCRVASPATWEAQWSDLWGFYDWAELLTGSYPPWADDEELHNTSKG